MKKPTVIAALLLLSASALTASARTTITVGESGDENPVTFTLTDATVLDFSTDPAAFTVIEAPGKQTSFPLTDDTVIKFTMVSGVSDAVSDISGLPGLRTNPVENFLEFTSAPGVPCRLGVYSLQGALLASVPAWQGESVDVSDLAPGLYIVNFNNQSIKFYKK